MEEFGRLGLWRPDDFVLQDSGPQPTLPADAATATATVTVHSGSAVRRPSDAEQKAHAAEVALMAARKEGGTVYEDQADQPLEQQAAEAAEGLPAGVTGQATVAMGVLALAVAGMAWTAFGHLRQPWRYDTVGRQ